MKFNSSDKVILFICKKVYFNCTVNEHCGNDRYDIIFEDGTAGVYPANYIYPDTRANREVFTRYETHVRDADIQAEIILRGVNFKF